LNKLSSRGDPQERLSRAAREVARENQSHVLPTGRPTGAELLSGLQRDHASPFRGELREFLAEARDPLALERI